MAIIEGLDQGTEKWLEYRRSKIMATSAAVILENNPFKTPLELWEEMLLMRPSPVINDAMKRGSDLEPIARELACKEIGIQFEPCVFESDKNSWQAASLDGLSPCGKYILEIKSPNEKTHLMAINGEVPSYYLDQVQHQLACTKAEKAYYFSYRPEHEKTYAIVEIDPDHEYHNFMIEKEHEFYKCLCTFCPPSWKFKEKKTKKYA